MSSRRPDVDPYLPGHGDAAYDVRHYDLTLDYSVQSNRLQGTATVHCTVLEETTTLHLDLHALRVASVNVPGRRVKRYRTGHGRLTVTLESALPAGEEVEVHVKYGGRPSPMRARGLDPAGWEELSDGVIVAAQPHGAPTWFPCNDRPSAKATYDLRIDAPHEYHVEFSGEPVSVERRGASRRWVFRQDVPMASYLATLQIGRYEVSSQSGPVPMRLVAPPSTTERAGFAESFGRSPQMMSTFVELFGPYPFAGYTTVVTEDELEIPLESQALSTFGANFVDPDWDTVRLVAHEMAHQWFGNAVTLTAWRDIWLHEGFACYAEWLWSEASGGTPAQAWAAHHHERLAGAKQPAPLADPGPSHMFDDWVYKRGALTLHAIRARVGDEAFFALLRSWVQDHRGGSVSTGRFREHVSAGTGEDLDALLRDWLDEVDLPALPDTGRADA